MTVGGRPLCGRESAACGVGKAFQQGAYGDGGLDACQVEAETGVLAEGERQAAADVRAVDVVRQWVGEGVGVTVGGEHGDSHELALGDGLLADRRRQLLPHGAAVPRGRDELGGHRLGRLGGVAHPRDLYVGAAQRIDGEQGRHVERQGLGEFAQRLGAGGDGVTLAGEHADAGRRRDLVVDVHTSFRERLGTMTAGWRRR